MLHRSNSCLPISLDVAKRLLKEAAKAPKPNGHYSQHAAVVLDKAHRPICYGYNLFSRHAEHHAIGKLFATPHFRGKKPYAILVVRVNKAGKFVGSKPCRKCQKLIDAAGLRAYHT